MRTTVDLDTNLFRQAKARAATEGIPLKRLIEQSLRSALGMRSSSPRTRDLRIPILKAKGSKKIHFPSDVAHRLDGLEDRERHAASLRR